MYGIVIIFEESHRNSNLMIQSYDISDTFMTVLIVFKRSLHCSNTVFSGVDHTIFDRNLIPIRHNFCLSKVVSLPLQGRFGMCIMF